jgi:DNA-binding NtrC family response regulator
VDDKTHIVVVDDETEILELYKSVLGDTYRVSSFNSPVEFLKALTNNEIKDVSLVITDLKMPQMDGLDMIRQAQAKNYFFPFIMLSGYLDKQAVIDAVDVGVFKLLEKPTEFEVLLSTIDQLLMEHEIYKVRKEIRTLTSQLREMYSMVRLVLLQYIPEDVIDKIVLDGDPGGDPKAKMSFESLLEKLEGRLDTLLASEKMILELKSNRFKS